MANQLGYPTSLKAVQKRLSGLLKQKNHHACVAVENGVVLGWMDLEVIASLIYDVRVELRVLVVDENHRGKGIGKAMLNYAKTFARKKKVKTLFLRTNIKREGAHKFYEREGFSKTKTSFKYEFDV